MNSLRKYFDHNATTPLCKAASSAGSEVAQSHWHNPSSLYREAGAARLLLEDLREELADLLGCGDEPERVIFTSGATEANNAVMRYWATQCQLENIVISNVEHPSVRESALQAFGESSVEEHREILERLSSAHKYQSVSVMAANNETGALHPWQEIAKLCREQEIPFHCDAAQWIGKLPASEFAEHCDFVTGCAHKFGGPKGVGFLIIPTDKRYPDFLCQVGGPQENNHRAGTEDLAAIAAMVAALRQREPQNSEHEEQIVTAAKSRDQFEEKIQNSALRDESTFRIIAASVPRLWNTSMFIAPYQKNLKWLTRLSREGFAVSTGSACSAGKNNPSHVMEAMGLTYEEMARVIRVSGGWETEEQDWLDLAEALLTIAEELSQ